MRSCFASEMAAQLPWRCCVHNFATLWLPATLYDRVIPGGGSQPCCLALSAPEMLCSLSGAVPEEPVVCLKTGHLYEKRLIEKHIETTGRDPVTREDITVADLLPIKSASALRYSASCSLCMRVRAYARYMIV